MLQSSARSVKTSQITRILHVDKDNVQCTVDHVHVVSESRWVD